MASARLFFELFRAPDPALELLPQQSDWPLIDSLGRNKARLSSASESRPLGAGCFSPWKNWPTTS